MEYYYNPKGFNLLSKKSPIRLDAPASYRIIVQGIVPDLENSIFLGLTISVDKEKKTTCITGELKDQAALTGLINILYDLRFSILLIEHTSKKITV